MQYNTQELKTNSTARTRLNLLFPNFSLFPPKADPPLADTFHFSLKRGMSVIETIVYVGILGIVIVFITNSLIRVISTYQHARAEREVLSHARLMMETLNKHISYAQEVYAPTSRFNTNDGQISLITSRDAQPEHATAFFDAWSDGNQLLVRNEGDTTSSLSSAAVRVTQFRIERIFQGLGREALKVTLSVASNALPLTASTTLNSTTALRGGY